MGVRIGTEDVHVLCQDNGNADVRFGTLYADVLSGGSSNHRPQYFGTCCVHILGKTPNVTTYYGTSNVAVLCTRTPIFTWIDTMLIQEVFPKDIGYNSVGSTRFSTDVTVVDSGADQRISRWSQPLMEYDVAYGVRDIQQLQELVNFFRSVGRGKFNSFYFYDHLDHTSQATAFIDQTTDYATTDTDQFIATGDWVTTQFQLQKTYHSPNNISQFVRPITAPIADSVLVAVNGVAVFNFTVDTTTGLLTFTPRVSLTALASMNLTWNSGTGNITIVSPTAQFSDFQVGDHVVMNGWVNWQNNTDQRIVNQLAVVSISGDFKTIVLSSVSGFTGFINETARSGINFYVHPAPATGVGITAGFEFYVPVRFDTDKLPVTLEEYGVGGAADVKLIEVRPGNL